MQEKAEITLRYFDVRGRAQFVRGLLTHRDVAFTDQRIHLNEDLSSWRTRDREDRSISGSFQKLPTLEWNGLMVSEILVILNFLHQRLGDAGTLTDERNLQHSMLVSSAFLDLLTPCINLIWSDVFNPGADVPKATAIARGRLELHLKTVDETLSNWSWFVDLNQRNVMAADAVLWEALDVIRETFAGAIKLDGFDTLAAFYERCPGRDTFRSLLEQHPATITARPGEAEALAIIRG